MNPIPVRMPPAVATQRGPIRSCSRPAGTITSANTMQAMEYGRALSASDQPHSEGITFLMTLQV